MRTIFTLKRLLSAAALLALPLLGHAQAPVQSPNFVATSPSYTPQYAVNGSTMASRLPFMYRATLSGLTPSTLYRYTLASGLLTANNGQVAEAAGGAGNAVFVTAGTTPATSTYVYSASQSLTSATAGSYGTFTTSASGSYTGWFGIVPTANAARYTVGTVNYPIITLATDAVPATIAGRYFLNESFTVLGYGTAATATLGTYLQGSSAATAKNLVALYDNQAGTGRPLATTLVENSGAAVAGTSTLYVSTAGSYNTIIPNVNANGVRRAVQLSVVNGSLVGCQSSATAFAGTANPVGGSATPVAISSTTAPLDVNNCTSTPANTSLSITNGTFSNTAVNSSSSSTSFTLTNASGSPQSVTLSTTSTSFSYTGTNPIVVPANGSSTFTITFSPTTATTYNGTVTAAVTGFQNVVSSSFSATGTAPANTALTVTNGTFSSTASGSTSTSTGFLLNNSSGSSQTVTLSTSGAPFTLTTTSYTVPAGGSVPVTITFSPTSASTFTGTLTAVVSGFQNVVSSSFSATSTAPAPTATNYSATTLLAGIQSFEVVSGTNLAGSTVTVTGSTAGTVTVGTPTSSATLTTVTLLAPQAGSFTLNVTNNGTTLTQLVTVTTPPTGFFEPFEAGAKSGYTAYTPATATSVALTTGAWTFTEALLGAQAPTAATPGSGEKKNNGQAVRFRTAGVAAMAFDKTGGAGIITFQAALYGTDAAQATPASALLVEISTNGGSGYTTLGSITPTATLSTYSLTANVVGSVRLRFTSNTTGTAPRLDLDDVQISDFAAPNLTVSTPDVIPAGTYNNITVTGTGQAALSGNVVVNGAFTVQANGQLTTDCTNTITGSGSFTLAAGALLAICDPAGLTTSGATGAVRVTGTRSFSPAAFYMYNGTVAQVTGNGLPSAVYVLLANNAAGVSLSGPTGVAGGLGLLAGNFNTNNQLTQLSSATGTATVAVDGGTISGNVTVQRYIDPSLNAGAGYRHYSSPVVSTTFGDLGTPGFTPQLNTAYNTSATPGLVTPFPTVFGYDEQRVVTATSNMSPFNKGWAVPTGNLEQGRGYTVNIGAAEKVDFVGALTFANVSKTLTRAASTDAGWHLLGNPYAAPLDMSTVTIPAGINSAIYVFESNGQYTGNYRSYVNGVGGNPIVPVAQGFFVRATTNGAVFPMTFANTSSDYTLTSTAFHRNAPSTTTAAPKPLVQLALRNATNTLADNAYVYFQAGATAGFDARFDAEKLPNTHGLNLASTTGTEFLAINGLPELTVATIVPLTVYAPAAGSYVLEAAQLANLPTGTVVVLRDALAGTRTVLTTGSSYRFSLAGTSAVGRFTLEFQPAAAPLATNAQALAAQVQLYPNPTAGRFHLALPLAAITKPVTAQLTNALGQVVLTRTLTTAEADFDVRSLAAGVYNLRLTLEGTQVVRRVVVQ